MKSVTAVGNALTDVLVNLPGDDILRASGLERGSMSPVGGDRQNDILRSLAGQPYTLSLGGSAANTIRALARLGTPTGFVGKVGRDETGDFFAALTNLGVEPSLFRGRGPSGRCVSLVSPDGERTMVTCLGAASEMEAEEMTPALFGGFDCLYLEGYLVQNHELIAKAARLAHEGGMKVAIDLASFNVVEENLEFLRTLVAEYVDIVFANEAEARSFTGENEPLNAAQMCELAVVKTGMAGAIIKGGPEVVEVGIMEAARRVDTTGAGDFYAAGFLHGLCDGMSLRQCGTLGAIAAGKVIEVVGTTFGDDVWEEIARLAVQVRAQNCLF